VTQGKANKKKCFGHLGSGFSCNSRDAIQRRRREKRREELGCAESSSNPRQLLAVEQEEAQRMRHYDERQRKELPVIADRRQRDAQTCEVEQDGASGGSDCHRCAHGYGGGDER
jgi:hypothetical protein